jgi:hypothetical protein
MSATTLAIAGHPNDHEDHGCQEFAGELLSKRNHDSSEWYRFYGVVPTRAAPRRKWYQFGSHVEVESAVKE